MSNATTYSDLRARISEATGFDQGERFADEQAVIDYMSPETQRELWGDQAADEETLDEWADTIIEHRWHMLPTYYLAFADGENGGFDIVEDFRAADDAAANAWAEANEARMEQEYDNTEWYILDDDGENING